MASNLYDKAPLIRTSQQHLVYGAQYITNADGVKDFFQFFGDLSKKWVLGRYLGLTDGSRLGPPIGSRTTFADDAERAGIDFLVESKLS